MSSPRKKLGFAEIRRKFFQGASAQWINSGDCFNWALKALDRCRKRKVEAHLCSVRGHGGHAFLYVDGLYYDAAYPNGTKNWRKLVSWTDPCMIAEGELIKGESEDDFRSYWGRIGNRALKY